VADRGDRHATGLQCSVKVRVRNWHDLALADSGLEWTGLITSSSMGWQGGMLSRLCQVPTV
jgi:hypothetical protein